MGMRISAAVRSALAGVLLTAAVSSCTPAHPAQPMPAAQSVAPDPRVGAVFLGGGALHTCSGAVLASPAGDLILTAAHCLAGDVDARFVPGLDGGVPPEDGGVPPEGGVRIEAVYLDPRWVRDQDPLADYAIARVRTVDGDGLEAVADGGLRLGTTPAAGTDVTVTGYAAGVGGGPATCRAPTEPARQGFPVLRCGGLVAGFSGAPWITGSVVSGVIGGLDGGGCADEVSYSAPFDGAVAALLARAEAGGPGDEVPTVFDDGCG